VAENNLSSPLRVEPPSPALTSRNPVAWLAVFGPGAIIASLTIGTGELIFSTRGGALFGYRILFLFVLISLLKWGLVLASARHIVLTGVHPYRRMMFLPGPRGWFPIGLLLLTAIAMPIWTSFISGVVGNFTAWLTDTREMWNGTTEYAWGGLVLFGVLILSARGGYSVLERVQMVIVGLLVACAAITLVLYDPDWLEMLKGAFIPQAYQYPEWIGDASTEESVRLIADRSVWVETTTYVGVIGGAGFDYMAYTSFLRAKRWGWAGISEASPETLESMAADPQHPARRWLRAPLVDCSVSFIIIIAFSAVFVASGVVVLGPQHKVPTEARLLDLQAEFVTGIHPWLLPIYVGGAFLTMLGTLYGTIEIGQVILTEISRAIVPGLSKDQERLLRRTALLWCGAGGYIALAYSGYYTWSGGDTRPRLLLAMLTPVNLFTGVLSCGLFCFLLIWMDRRFLPRGLRMHGSLAALNLFSGTTFIALAILGFWNGHFPEIHFTATRWFALGTISILFMVGVMIARRARLDSRD
jgi:hypothetical protein